MINFFKTLLRRRDCLRQLIVTVCDRGEASKLISFQYGPMENEVSEKITISR